MRINERGGSIEIENAEFFDIFQTFDCGQTFRFERVDDFTVEGVAYGKLLRLRQKGDKIGINCTLSEFEDIWKHYLALDCDYSEINGHFALGDDEVLSRAAEYGKGIRILRQDPWEALCSFIISQNNNIKRISGIVDKLCSLYGKEIENGVFAFPAVEDLAGLSVEDLAPIKSGFRAKYIVDAVEKVLSGEVDLKALENLSYNDAKEELIKIKGVGSKVADCVLLYGFHKLEGFPMDVWMKRAMALLFPNLTGEDFGEFAGIAQQYIFHYARFNLEK